MDYLIFRKRMKRLLDSSGKTMRDLAADLGISAPTLSRYINGDRIPELSYILKVAEHFNVSVDWLVGANGNKYDIIPQELQEIACLYGVASEDDKRVIRAVLKKYMVEEHADEIQSSEADQGQ